MRILLIDNNIEAKGAVDLRRELVRPGVTVETRRGPEGDFPKSIENYSAVVASGSHTCATDESPWVRQHEQLFRQFLNADKPILGVCFGHQVLARMLGGLSAVGTSATPEHGWTRIQIQDESRLFQGLPKTFYSFSSHFDQVVSVSGAQVTATSARCGVQALEVSGKAVFGIQFHPEKDDAECIRTLERWKKDKKSKRHLMFPNDTKKYYDPTVAEKIFSNFLEMCR